MLMKSNAGYRLSSKAIKSIEAEARSVTGKGVKLPRMKSRGSVLVDEDRPAGVRGYRDVGMWL
jgi:hypothetical protein